MPSYIYECQNLNCETVHQEKELKFIPIAERDDQHCPACDYPLTRKIRFTGSVWAPTAGGMR